MNVPLCKLFGKFHTNNCFRHFFCMLSFRKLLHALTNFKCSIPITSVQLASWGSEGQSNLLTSSPLEVGRVSWALYSICVRPLAKAKVLSYFTIVPEALKTRAGAYPQHFMEEMDILLELNRNNHHNELLVSGSHICTTHRSPLI